MWTKLSISFNDFHTKDKKRIDEFFFSLFQIQLACRSKIPLHKISKKYPNLSWFPWQEMSHTCKCFPLSMHTNFLYCLSCTGSWSLSHWFQGQGDEAGDSLDCVLIHSRTHTHSQTMDNLEMQTLKLHSPLFMLTYRLSYTGSIGDTGHKVRDTLDRVPTHSNAHSH